MSSYKEDVGLELSGFIAGQKVVSTHSHHLPDREFEGFSLASVLRRSYVDWCGEKFGETAESREAYLGKVRYKSCFVWLEKSLRELYGFKEPLTAGNWGEVSSRIRAAHSDSSHHLRVLKEKCGYDRIVMDAYWNPGSDNGHPDVFTPTFRVDPLFFAYSESARDHDGNRPSDLFGPFPTDLEGFLAWVRSLISSKKEQGCVALKCALAYERGLDFQKVNFPLAAAAMRPGSGIASKEEITNFQDFLFDCICGLAAEFALPLQCHTGLGQLAGTRAMMLRGAVQRHPQTRFVLFHCGFPWTSDILALAHNYPNVYPDLCWLPLLSPTVARRTLHELIEVGTSDKVCWGCDTWTSEESYGALLALRDVLGSVLADKVRSGYFSMNDAKEAALNILRRSAAALYGF